MNEGIGQKVQQSRQDKSREALLWDLTRAFLEGKQYLAFDQKARSLVTAADPVIRGRIVINVLAPLYRTLTSLLAVNYPGCRVLPSSPSQEDLTRARAGEMALEYYWAVTDMQAVYAKVVRWLLTTGNVGLHTYYHPGDKKVCTKCVSPYDIFPEPGAIELDECEWWAIRSLMTRQDLQNAYPDKAEDIGKAAAYDERDQRSFVTQEGVRVPEDRMEVFDVYYRDGKHKVILGTHDALTLLESSVPAGVVPFQMIRYTDIPGRLWGLSPFAHVLDLQSMYNRGRNLQLEAAETMANPMWMVPNTSEIGDNVITNRPGKVVRYNPVGGPPQRVEGVGLPPDFHQGLQLIQSEILDLTGVHSTTLGKRAIGISSGKAIEALSALDVGQLQMTQSTIEEATRVLAKTVLILMRSYYTEAQMVRMMDNTGRVIWRELNAANLSENPEVQIEAGSLFRMESEDRDAKTLKLYELKLIDAQEARVRLALHLGDYKATKKMEAWAHAADILKAATGALGDDIGVEILPTDDLTTIRDTFDEYIKTEDFIRLPSARQEYVVSILKAVSGKLNPDSLAEANWAKVWPPQPKAPEEEQQYLAATDSPLIQEQVATEGSNVRQLAARMMQDPAAAEAGPERGGQAPALTPRIPTR